ncbi:hypothetical protein J6590_021045 [Homalodisca vitripennis]|nr:hypothetical protein J6590_021045 [Homalodisca vitripennis]
MFHKFTTTVENSHTGTLDIIQKCTGRCGGGADLGWPGMLWVSSHPTSVMQYRPDLTGPNGPELIWATKVTAWPSLLHACNPDTSPFGR